MAWRCVSGTVMPYGSCLARDGVSVQLMGNEDFFTSTIGRVQWKGNILDRFKILTQRCFYIKNMCFEVFGVT